MPIQQMLLGTGSSSGGGSIDPYISGYLHYHGSSAAAVPLFFGVITPQVIVPA